MRQIITVASMKGGSGKSTLASCLAVHWHLNGRRSTIIDADPNHPLARWAKGPGIPDGLKVLETNSEEQLVDTIEDAARRTAFVIIDLEGTASSAVGFSPNARRIVGATSRVVVSEKTVCGRKSK